MQIISVTVVGDSGKPYVIDTVVEKGERKVRCACPAYRYSDHSTCKHITFVMESMRVFEHAS